MTRNNYTNKQHQVVQTQSKTILFLIVSVTLNLLTKNIWKVAGKIIFKLKFPGEMFSKNGACVFWAPVLSLLAGKLSTVKPNGHNTGFRSLIFTLTCLAKLLSQNATLYLHKRFENRYLKRFEFPNNSKWLRLVRQEWSARQ